MHLCPVCGYNKLPFPPTDYHICPCCGTEFEADDLDFSYAELRSRWIATGASWFSGSTEAPQNWNPQRQLMKAGMGFEASAHSTSSAAVAVGTVNGKGLSAERIKPNSDTSEVNGKFVLAVA